MKKLLFGVVGIILALVAAVMVVPSMVDWNDYKDEIAARAKAATGRNLTIGGDIRIAFLPAPALVAGDVRLSNLEGAVAPEMVRLKSIEVRIALGPLLGGNLQVETINLVEPVIEIEVLADGSSNLEFETGDGGPPPEAAEGDAAPAEGGAVGSGPAVRLDNFSVKDGTLIYRDTKLATVERFENINARFTAISLSGPFESSGAAVVRGIPIDYEVSISEIIQERTVPFSLTLAAQPGGTKVQMSGALVSLSDDPKFKGKVKGQGDKLAGLVRAFTGAGPLPGLLAQGFGFAGDVVASASGVEVKNLTLNLGEATAGGELSVKLDEAAPAAADFAARIVVSRIDLDKWLALPADNSKPVLPRPVQSATYTAGESKATIELNPPRPQGKEPAEPALFALPTNIKGSLNVSVESVSFKGGIVRQVLARAELAGGEITISQLSGQFPGGSDVAVFGVVAATDGQPQFEGEVEASASDLRGVLRWLGVAEPNVPSGRLRKMTLSSRLTATPGQVDITGLDLQFDSSRLTGGITVALRDPPAFGVNLILDRINLDAYLPPAAGRPAGKVQATDRPAAGAGKDQPADESTPEPADPLAGLNLLKSLSANLKAHVKTLVWRGSSIKDIVFDATVHNGKLTVRRASVAKLAGASANASGTIIGLGGVPEIEDVKFTAGAGDLTRLLRLAGVEPPVTPKKLGKVSLQGRIDGSVLKLVLDLTLKAAGAEMGLSGNLSFLPLISRFDGKVKVKHSNLSRLLGTLGVAYRPAGRIGGLDLAADIKGDAGNMTLSGLRAKIGKLEVNGLMGVRLDGPRPMISADLAAGEINVDPFLPAKRTAGLDSDPEMRFGRPGLVPAAWAVPRPAAYQLAVSVAAAGPAAGGWSSEPIDLSALEAFDADLKLKSPAISYQKYRLENADLAATVSGGELKINRLAGQIFGGALQGTGTVRSDLKPRIETVITLKDMDVGQALLATTGKKSASGRMALDLKLAATGESQAELISSLGGGGSLALNRLDVRSAARGSALASALSLVEGLNKLGGVLGGNRQGPGLADIDATFTIERGVARSNDLSLVSNVGNAAARGLVDLPRWRIDVGGDVRLAKNLLTALLDKSAQSPRTLPFSVKGKLDAPDVKLDTSKLTGGGLPIPGGVGRKINEQLKKKGLGGIVDKILPGIFGGGQAQPQSPPPPRSQPQSGPPPPQDQSPPQSAPPPPPPPPQQQKLKPQDLLKELFKGLGG